MLVFRGFIFVFLVSAGLQQSQAAEWTLPADGWLVGEPLEVSVGVGDSLVSIGRRYGVGYDNMLRANPALDIWLPPVGAAVRVPQHYLLPGGPRRGIVLNLAEKRLFYYPSNSNKVWVFAAGIGREGWPTPVGETKVIAKRAFPDWFPPVSIRMEAAQSGVSLPAKVPAGASNPLGDHALYLSWHGYLMHGTHRPAGVGMAVSHGCIRLYPDDIARLFDAVSAGEPVRIVDEPVKLGWQHEALWLEVHPPAYRAADTEVTQALINRIITLTSHGASVNWSRVHEAVRRADGIPVRIGQRPLP